MSFRSPGPVTRGVLLTVLMSTLAALHAQAPQPMLPHAGLPGLRTVSPTEYSAHVQALLNLVASCQRIESACDSKAVGDLDDSIHSGLGGDIVERYGWLRDLLEDRNDPGHKRRSELLPHAVQRLTRDLAEANAPPPSVVLTDAQRSARNTVLGRKEFRSTETYSWRDRLAAWFSSLMDRLFGGAASLGRMAPWIGNALQWGTLLLAVALLFFWIYRALDRQRIAIGRLGGGSASARQEAESRAWAEQARGLAAQGAWREAVHALYWASIVLLEDRRTLRRSATRTPREALRLIDHASSLREPLQEQTGEFERIWYGLRPATSGDYSAALAQYQAIQGARNSVATQV